MKIEIGYGIARRLWFTSDTHFGHSNICRATTKWTGADNVTRDFKSLDHMNDTLVNNINEVVGEDDILIHLGDWSFGGFENIELFRNRINCKNVHLVFGNHDHHVRVNRNGIQSLFSSTHDYLHLDIRMAQQKGRVDRHTLILCHYPIASWDRLNDSSGHLHGHVHLPKHLRLGDGKSLDVGVDGNDYYPISLEEVVRLLGKQPIRRLTLPKDHHEKRLL